MSDPLVMMSDPLVTYHVVELSSFHLFDSQNLIQHLGAFDAECFIRIRVLPMEATVPRPAGGDSGWDEGAS